MRNIEGDADLRGHDKAEPPRNETPSAEERATFVGSLAEPGCRTQTVVYAIVSGAEYARY